MVSGVVPIAQLDAIIDGALLEDLPGGDLTSEVAVARGTLVACVGFVFGRVFERVDPWSRVTANVAEGARVEPGASLWTLEGKARALLAAERVALNLVQRMSGI